MLDKLKKDNGTGDKFMEITQEVECSKCGHHEKFIVKIEILG